MNIRKELWQVGDEVEVLKTVDLPDIYWGLRGSIVERVKFTHKGGGIVAFGGKVMNELVYSDEMIPAP